MTALVEKELKALKTQKTVITSRVIMHTLTTKMNIKGAIVSEIIKDWKKY